MVIWDASPSSSCLLPQRKINSGGTRREKQRSQDRRNVGGRKTYYIFIMLAAGVK